MIRNEPIFFLHIIVEFETILFQIQFCYKCTIFTRRDLYKLIVQIHL